PDQVTRLALPKRRRGFHLRREMSSVDQRPLASRFILPIEDTPTRQSLPACHQDTSYSVLSAYRRAGDNRVQRVDPVESYPARGTCACALSARAVACPAAVIASAALTAAFSLQARLKSGHAAGS